MQRFSSLSERETLKVVADIGCNYVLHSQDTSRSFTFKNPSKLVYFWPLMAGLGDLLVSQSTTTHFLGPAVLHVTTGLKFFWMVVSMVYVEFKLL